MKNKFFTLITGGNKGIGFEFAKLYAKDGENLILVGRNEKELLEKKNLIEKNFNVLVETLALDLSFESSIETLIDFINRKNIIINRLINNAGIGSFGYFEEGEYERDKKLISININALTNLTKYFLNEMKKRKTGEILNVSSTAAFVGGPKMSIYYSSKAYVLTLTEAIHEEAKEFNVKVSCLCPGPIKTTFQENAGIIKSEKAKKYLMEPEYVAKCGYKGLKNNKDIIIPGFKNKIMVLGTKFLPRKIIRKIIFSTNK